MRSNVKLLLESWLLKRTVDSVKDVKQRPLPSLSDCGLNLAITLQEAHSTLRDTDSGAKGSAMKRAAEQ